jgi:hypothetical protein
MPLDANFIWMVIMSTVCSLLLLFALAKVIDAISDWRYRRRERMLKELREELSRN